ncbi:MAG: IS110 family transposase [Solirubrobacteraceae bacterium]
MTVCSPGAIPRQPGDHTKTDQRDALKLARLHAAGQLRAVLVAAPELEALRDLVRAREDLHGDLMAARHRISKMLLRRREALRGPPGQPWASPRHAARPGAIDDRATSPRLIIPSRRRQNGRPAAAIDAAWRAQLRLSGRWAHLDASRARHTGIRTPHQPARKSRVCAWRSSASR